MVQLDRHMNCGASMFQRLSISANVMLTMGFGPALIIFLACIHQIASAQEAEQDASDVMDEVVVQGEKSLTRLRQEIYTAEDDFYAQFNSINDDDDFDIHCFKEARTGSRVMRRVCRANFERKATAEEARGLMAGFPTPSAAGVIAHKTGILLERMEELVTEHPELLKALTDFYNAKIVYETEREKR